MMSKRSTHPNTHRWQNSSTLYNQTIKTIELCGLKRRQITSSCKNWRTWQQLRSISRKELLTQWYEMNGLLSPVVVLISQKHLLPIVNQYNYHTSRDWGGITARTGNGCIMRQSILNSTQDTLYWVALALHTYTQYLQCFENLTTGKTTCF